MAKRTFCCSAGSAPRRPSTSSAGAPTAGWPSSTQRATLIHMTPSRVAAVAALLPGPGAAPRVAGPAVAAGADVGPRRRGRHLRDPFAGCRRSPTTPTPPSPSSTSTGATRRRRATARRTAVPGLADVVEDGVPLDDVIQPTSNPRLSLVAGRRGRRRPAAGAGPQRTRWSTVLDELGRPLRPPAPRPPAGAGHERGDEPVAARRRLRAGRPPGCHHREPGRGGARGDAGRGDARRDPQPLRQRHPASGCAVSSGPERRRGDEGAAGLPPRDLPPRASAPPTAGAARGRGRCSSMRSSSRRRT